MQARTLQWIHQLIMLLKQVVLDNDLINPISTDGDRSEDKILPDN